MQRGCTGQTPAISATVWKGSQMNHREVLGALATVAAGRDHINTRELAAALNRRPQTLRKNLCLCGHVWGLCPIRLSRRGPLLWRVSDVIKLLQGATS